MSLMSAALISLLTLVAPLLVRALRVPVPDIVVQILLGIVVGPQVLGWAHADQPVVVLSVIGLAFLLFLAGLELDFEHLRGPTLSVAVRGFLMSMTLAVAVGTVLSAIGLVRSPLLIAVILSATSVGIVIPVLADTGDLTTPLGRLVTASGSLAEVLPVVLLSLLFTEHGAGLGKQTALLLAFCGLAATAVVTVLGIERWPWLTRTLVALQDTTAQIRVRAAVALLLGFAALAVQFGLEAILGAFLAGAAISLLDRDRAMSHRPFRGKLRAVGYGALIPFFFVATGMSLDVRGFVADAGNAVRVPLFLGALLLVRGVPALLYRAILPRARQVVTAGLLQSVNLSIPVVGGAIGVRLGVIRPDVYVALVVAGLLSVIVFPVAASLLAAQRPTPTVATRDVVG
ncbi:cation:proton antiporter [Actinoplanes sp. CA-030573]|uniref:cation:proton antiporter n=1 Tax=Actinoplanes sp. CA-030573 TaxID=3239898 RepID=UPI003D8F26AF